MTSRLGRRLVALLACLGLVNLLLGGCMGFKLTPTPEPIVLRFAYYGHSEAMQSLFTQFTQQHPWITVESVEVGRESQDMATLAVSADLDLFRSGSSALRMAQSQLIRPLDELQLGDFAEIRDDYAKQSWEALAMGGQQWGIPAGLDVMVTYVNLDQVTALGVDLPQGTWTLDDFTELVNGLNFPDGLPNSSAKLYGFCTAVDSMDPIVFIYLHGGGIVDNISSPSRVTLDDPLTIEGVQIYSDFYNRYRAAPSRDVIRKAFPRGGIYEAQIRGACGAWFGQFSDRGGLRSQYEWTIKWKMLPLPSDQAAFGLGEVDGYFLTATSRHPKEALVLLRFLADHWEAAGFQLPPRMSLITSKEYVKSIGAEAATLAAESANQLAIAPEQTSPGLQTVGARLLSSIQTIVSQDLDPADVLVELQAQLKGTFNK